MNRLKELRQKKGDTQEVVAKAMGVTRRGYQKWENEESQIKPEKAQQLADYFGVSVGYLLGYSDYKAETIRDLLFHEIKALKELNVIKFGRENFISENQVLNVIDKYIK